MSELIKQGYFVKIGEYFYKVSAIEPFQYETGEESTAHFSSVADGSESGYKNITTLEPDDKPRRLFQVWMGVKNGMTYYFKVPTGTNRFGVDEDKDIGFIDNNISPFDDPNELFEMWLVNEYYPAINAKNATGVTLTPKVYFRGMKYDIDEVDEETKMKLINGTINYREITIGGVRTGLMKGG